MIAVLFIPLIHSELIPLSGDELEDRSQREHWKEVFNNTNELCVAYYDEYNTYNGWDIFQHANGTKLVFKDPFNLKLDNPELFV